MNNSQIATKMEAQIEQFSGILSIGLPKVLRRLVLESMLGIHTRGSVKLTEIGRSLREPIPLKKTQNRICRQLRKDNIREVVGDNILEKGSSRIRKETLLILDISDITKKYAKKMEHLARVRDGSSGEITNGYWTMNVVGAELDKGKITPLHTHLYSQKSPEFVSENVEIIKAVDRVTKHTGERGIWAIDRGGDRRRGVIAPLMRRGQRFIIRMVGNRDLMYKGKEAKTIELARSCRMLFAEKLIREDKKREKSYHIELGFRRVKLPGFKKENLNLVVVNGFGKEPMMLLTNIEVTKSRKALLSIVLSYIRRWQIEETLRFCKQSYNLEDIRLLTYRRLQNMMVLVWGVMYFTAVWLGDRIKLSILAHYALKSAKRLFGIPDFRYYAIADGIKEILAGYSKHIRLPVRADPQMSLF